jgi:hypothetical protein
VEYEDGRIFRSRFEVSQGQYVSFVSVYGIPHSPDDRLQNDQETNNENETFQQMRRIQCHIKMILLKAHKDKELVYVVRDLQDTPGTSKAFYYGSSRIAKTSAWYY